MVDKKIRCFWDTVHNYDSSEPCVLRVGLERGLDEAVMREKSKEESQFAIGWWKGGYGIFRI